MGKVFSKVICNDFKTSKTVHPMLSDRCPVRLSVSVCLSVTLVHCFQTVGQIKMKLGMQIGLSPGYIVLDGVQV